MIVYKFYLMNFLLFFLSLYEGMKIYNDILLVMCKICFDFIVVKY